MTCLSLSLSFQTKIAELTNSGTQLAGRQEGADCQPGDHLQLIEQPTISHIIAHKMQPSSRLASWLQDLLCSLLFWAALVAAVLFTAAAVECSLLNDQAVELCSESFTSYPEFGSLTLYLCLGISPLSLSPPPLFHWGTLPCLQHKQGEGIHNRWLSPHSCRRQHCVLPMSVVDVLGVCCQPLPSPALDRVRPGRAPL